MKKQHTLSEKLKRYSLLTGGVLAGVLAADAQIIYTDVVPDFVGSGDMDHQIDLNNDGIIDSQTCDLWTYEMMNPAGTHAMNQETKKLITIN